MRTRLAVEELGDLLERPILAVLATQRPGGQTLLSPVWHEWRDGGFNLVILAGDVKSRHLTRNPQASVLVTEQAPPFRSLEVSGPVALSRPPDIQELVVRLAVRYYGDTVGRARAKGFEAYDMELVRLEPGAIRTWDFVDEFGEDGLAGA